MNRSWILNKVVSFYVIPNHLSDDPFPSFGIIAVRDGSFALLSHRRVSFNIEGHGNPKREYSDEPWSDTELEDSANDIAFDDSDDEAKVDGGLFDVEVKCMAAEENALPCQHAQATSTINKGKEVMVAGFRDEDDGYDSE
ncbi:hypothetical protein PIB30_070844 [Stylosanthes scabra]|uniref:Uncharacterized protein n=1 Tax=Stylosanthes scabra TaxID=79078 RepID=A0ABU6RPE1_9FABA|nr:hypothetical protein [Stylosanthes scabra]